MMYQVLAKMGKSLSYFGLIVVGIGLLYMYELKTDVDTLTNKLETSKATVLMCRKDLEAEKYATAELVSAIEVQNKRVREVQSLLSEANKKADEKVREVIRNSERTLDPTNSPEELNKWLLDTLQ